MLLLKKKIKLGKKSSAKSQEFKKCFFSYDIFISLSKKSHEGGPINLNINLVSPKLECFGIYTQNHNYLKLWQTSIIEPFDKVIQGF